MTRKCKKPPMRVKRKKVKSKLEPQRMEKSKVEQFKNCDIPPPRPQVNAFNDGTLLCYHSGCIDTLDGSGDIYGVHRVMGYRCTTHHINLQRLTPCLALTALRWRNG